MGMLFAFTWESFGVHTMSRAATRAAQSAGGGTGGVGDGDGDGAPPP
jgi:hypothetical protein